MSAVINSFQQWVNIILYKTSIYLDVNDEGNNMGLLFTVIDRFYLYRLHFTFSPAQMYILFKIVLVA